MDSLALALVLSGSLLHLGWNSLTKSAQDKLAFLWLALLIPSLPGYFFLWKWGMSPEHAPASLALSCLVASVLVHAFYFFTLARSYELADLSFVYPYCRGIGALLATVAGVSFLGEKPSALGLLGISLTTLAAFWEPVLTTLRRSSRLSRSAWAFTVLSGILIAAYLVIDKVGVTHLDPLPYLAVMITGMSWVIAPMVLQKRRWHAEWKRTGSRAFIASFFMASAYFVILKAMAFAPVSYVVSARASGIALSGVVGVLVFKENVSLDRWISILMITIGVICIGMA